MIEQREHYFYVSIAKFLFHHKEHGIVSVRDPITVKDAGKYGLSPLILYGLTVARLPIRWVTFTPVDQPKALRDVLLEAWHSAMGLRGRPDVLRISRHLEMSSPNLVQDMAKIGVKVEVADAKEKSLPASMRSAQDSSRWLRRKLDGKNASLTESTQSLCREAQNEHDISLSNGYWGVNSREVENKIQEWLSLPAQAPPAPTGSGGLDWKPGLWLSSWENSLPTDRPRYFNFDGFTGRTWLLTGEKAPEDIVEDDDFRDNDSDYDNAPEVAKNLVACWPNPPFDIAKCAGVTLRELQWFISGRDTLAEDARIKLEDLLGIEYDECERSYKEVGPYVLVAHKSRAIKEIYESITGGGDARPCEIAPRQGSADPSWRYVLINTFGRPPSIVMAPRGSKIADQLPGLLLNHSGIRHVSQKFYRDVVATCARACRKPADNIQEMDDFVERYREHWTNCFWLPD